MDFEAAIRAFELKALRQANKSVANAVESLFTSPVVLSPSPANPGEYSKGLLANQWYPELGGGYDLTNTMSTNPNGADSLSRIKAMLAHNAFFGKDNTITLTNSCKYAYRAEYLGWPLGEGTDGWVWSGRVGPYRMVGTSVNNFIGAYS